LPSRACAGGYWPAFRTTAGMIGVVTAVLTGSAAGLLATIAADHSAVAGFVTGGVVGTAALVALMWFQLSGLGTRPTSNGSLRMSKKGRRRVIDKINVPRCHVGSTRVVAAVCAALSHPVPQAEQLARMRQYPPARVLPRQLLHQRTHLVRDRRSA